MMNTHRVLCILVWVSSLDLSLQKPTGEDPSWSSQYITELKCGQVKSAGDLGATERELRRLMKEIRYFPIISKYGLNQLSEHIRERPIQSDGEASELCPVTKTLRSPSIAETKEIVGEFEVRDVRLTCDYTTLSHINCLADKTGDFIFRYETTRWTDGKEIILYTVCASTGYAGWCVKSKRKLLSTEQKQKVLKRVKKMGFDPRKSFEVPYDECNLFINKALNTSVNYQE